MKNGNKNKLYLLLAIVILLEQQTQLTANIKKYRYVLNQNETEKESQEKGNNNKKKDIYKWLGTVSEVISIVEQRAFKEVNFGDFIQESLKAAVPQIDAHSAFFSQKSYKAAIESTSGKFPGIGIVVISKTPEDDTLLIVDVTQNGPAFKTGIKSEDKIIEVDGKKLRGLSTDEVINNIKGKVGTEVSIKIVRNKKPLEFKVKREIIKDQTSTCYHFKNQNIYYLSLKLFTQNAANQMTDLLKKANKGKMNGLILDLRRNNGGLLDSAIDVASLFLPKKSLVVTTKNRQGEITSKYYTKKDPILKSDVPIFVLVDNFTASASEILAGCLRHYSEKLAAKENSKNKLMVFLVGTQTFGKGSVQEVIPISNGCALKLTILLYYLPNSKSIQAVGIEPDFLVKPKIIPSEEMRWMQELYGKESSLKKHITQEEANGKKIEEKKNKSEKNESEDNIKKGVDKEKIEDKQSWEEKQRESVNRDVQIKACINLINLLSLAKKYNPSKVNTRKKALEFLNKHYFSDKMIEIEKIE